MSITIAPTENLQQRHPTQPPRQSGTYATDDGHSIYWEQYGNPQGEPAVWLHGGPGAGGPSSKPELFDLEHWNLLAFDQRGCGRSTPLGETKHNTTPHLIADMEALRQHLGYTTWHVMGGSWGSTLALAYACTHPQQVKSLLLTSLFLGSEAELQGLYQPQGLGAQLYPQEYQQFRNFLPHSLRHDPIAGYTQMVHHSDPAVAHKAAIELCRWELTVLAITPDETLLSELSYTDELGAMMKIYTHYASQHCFITESLLNQATHKLKNTPIQLLHGRYDLLCPVANAFTFTQALPQTDFTVIPDAGHHNSHPSFASAVMNAIAKLSQ